MNEAFLLTTFGTRHAVARRGLDTFERALKLRFPKTTVQWAYASDRVRRLLKEGGEDIPAPGEAVDLLVSQGHERIVVQSLHVVPGIEFHEIVQMVGRKRRQYRGVEMAIGFPLMASYGDLMNVLHATLGAAPPTRQPRDAVILMGHGSRNHPSELCYVAAASVLKQLDPLARLGTLIGHPPFQSVLDFCEQNGVQRAYLLPLMSVAGVHTQRDMAGSHADSWSSQLESRGIECVPFLKGLTEIPAVADIWIQHAADALQSTREAGA